MSQSEAPDIDAPSATLLAIRNALKLGGSLVFTMSIALGIRVVLPRYLGPSRFGLITFADAFAATFFIVLNLGGEAYIRKEVATRPSHASDFFGGTVVLRVAMTGLLFAAMAIVLRAADRPSDVQWLVFLYGVAQFFVTANATLSAILHAKGRVGAMSVLAVATKIVWAAGVIAAMVTDAGLWMYAASYLASESIETVVLYRLAQKHIGLTFRVDIPATRKVLVASLPYYLNLFAMTAYGKLDMSLLEFKGNSKEVGWYGAAQAVAWLTLLVTPLIGWVLMPMLARAAARSREELFEQVRRSMELILTVAIPTSLVINLGSDIWIHVVFGAAFAPAAPTLRVLATMFVLTYVAIVYATLLIMLERAWTLTFITLGGLVVNVTLNLALIRFSMATFGPGGGGTGCALAMLGTEIFVTSCILFAVGRGAFDRRNVVVVAKSLAAYGVVVVVHRALPPLGLLRLAMDVALYLAIVLSTRALRLREMIVTIRDAIRARG